MGGGKDERPLRGGDGETQSVIDRAGGNLVVSCQAHENGQSGGISRSPGVGALLVDGHIPDGYSVGTPLAVLQGGFIKLIQPAAIFLEHQHVAITVARLGIAFDERIGRNGFRAGIAFIEESSKSYWHLGLSSCHNLIRDPDGLVVEGPRPKVWVKCYGGSDEVDVIRRIWIDR